MTATTHYLPSNTSFVFSRSDNCLRLPLPESFPCASPEDLITQSTRETVASIIYVVVLPLLFVIGIITNVLNCAVFYRQGLQGRVNTLLFMLSLLDLLFIIALYARYFNYTLGQLFGKEARVRVNIVLIRLRLVCIPDILNVISNLVSTLISVDRCVHIALPLQVQSLVSRRGFWVIFGVASLALACSGQIIVFSYDTACAYYSDSQVEPTWLVIPSTFYLENKAFLDILDSVVMFSVVPFLSLAVTAVTTTVTVVKLNYSMKWRNRCSSSSKLSGEEIGLTRMLVVISGIYIACVSPRVLTSLTRLLVPDYRPWTRLCNLVVVMETLMNVLVAINSVINFFVYISLGSKFKQTLRSLVLC
ncbi:hypothetical protein C0Q70_19725 [Pomacea canaliculata]|uniref:G-protein coupled receptors family 1 profile domain-containing protein n=1 Tax=Pomacea canaliculata TaxID=400727 RepID=A0A2T7NDJ3_POMCA|nr:FMRFamide receptor-like [Pomacea canaliculata]PVD19239.1 hypothetical protein C0Q70_19725 [Pomacea canaliculata]